MLVKFISSDIGNAIWVNPGQVVQVNAAIPAHTNKTVIVLSNGERLFVNDLLQAVVHRFGGPQHDSKVADFSRHVEDGHIMPTHEFLAWCNKSQTKPLTDNDGFGYPSNGKMLDNNIRILPSNSHWMPVNATHVVWYATKDKQ